MFLKQMHVFRTPNYCVEIAKNKMKRRWVASVNGHVGNKNTAGRELVSLHDVGSWDKGFK